ncbi:nitroreductase family protein [Roseobacteraceae bacterium S113]
MTQTVSQALKVRFGDVPELGQGADTLTSMLTRGSCRAFAPGAPSRADVALLCAAAMSAPTKSDLQQRDIIVLDDPQQRAALAELVGGQTWVAQAPLLVVFCGNNRRQRLVHDWHDIPFANDHVDALFNAIGDAAIALGAFVAAADAIGLGSCPISAVRNEAAAVSELLDLPRHVFPFAGLAVGYREGDATVSPRLPLDVTCHTDRYKEEALQERVAAYDARRADVQPYATQRMTAAFGESAAYGWSEDKARQYSQPERADFGAYLRAQGFSFE